MLVLARKKNESIVVGDNIEVFVVDISSDQVKIGVKAPSNVKVHRKEIYEGIKKEMKEAAMSDLSSLKNIEKIDKKGSI